MTLARRRIRGSGADYWPGFVDAMASLLLVLVFLLSVFMITQFLLANDLAGQKDTLSKLEAQIAELSDLLSLEKSRKSALETRLGTLSDTLDQLRQNNAELSGSLEKAENVARERAGRIASLKSDLSAAGAENAAVLARIELLNQQIAALRRQLASLQAALEASETRDKTAREEIKDLGARLNAALARQVRRLERYRSEFFGRLRDILSKRSDIQIVGDRFIFQSEVLFAKGDAALNADGRREIDKLAAALNKLAGEIPDDINWVLRVDGHTDKDPIATPEFPSNWELSTARAISVVRHLIADGVAPRRLVAAGFGEFQPLDPEDTPAAFRRNRRIELKLTER